MILKIALAIVLVGDGSRLPIPSETESALRRSQGLRGATLASRRLYEGPPPPPHKRKMQLNLKGGFERTFFLKGSAALCSPRKQGFLQSLKRSVGQGKDGEEWRRGQCQTGTRYPTRPDNFLQYPNPTQKIFRIIGYFWVSGI